MQATPSISVVIPVYNSAEYLTKLVHDIKLNLTSQNNKSNYEIIFVEDCGGDHSWEIIEQLSRQFTNVRGIKLRRNYGQHNALLCGIRSAKNDVIVTMDDDGQHPCEEILKLVSELQLGADIVYGTPAQENHGLLRNIASVSTKFMIKKLMGVSYARETSAFRAFKVKLRDAFEDFRGATVNIDIMLTWATTSCKSIEVTSHDRKYGKSGYNFSKLVNHAINMITGFSGAPLRIASYFGILFSMFGFLILLYILSNYAVRGSSVPGFAFLASLITLFSGVQLFTVGIIGEYVSRIHFRSMDRPPYVIKEKI